MPFQPGFGVIDLGDSRVCVLPELEEFFVLGYSLIFSALFLIEHCKFVMILGRNQSAVSRFGINDNMFLVPIYSLINFALLPISPSEYVSLEWNVIPCDPI